MSLDYVSDLDTILLKLNSKDSFSVRDSLQGILIYGGIGSGKTSASGRALAAALLRAGYGLCILCAKIEEVALWRAYCQEHGRENSIIVFDRSRHFNFLAYEFARKGVEGANSATDLLMRIIKSADRTAGEGGGREGEAIWTLTTREMILNTITVLYAVLGTVNIEDIVEFVTSMPANQPQTEEERQKTTRNYALVLLTKMLKRPKHPLPKHTIKRLCNYWFSQFPKTPEKMRGSIIACVAANLNRFSDGILRECFTTTTDLVPEMVFNGAVIILAFTSLTDNDEGTIAQVLFKEMFQRAVQNRNSLPEHLQTRPVALYADESQFYIAERDAMFLSTCRGSRCAVVYLTQNLPNYLSQLGKDKSDAVTAFTGLFASKIFHSNSDMVTNKMASELIGRGIKLRKSQSSGTSNGSQTSGGGSGGFTNTHGMGTSANANHGWNESNGTNESSSTQEVIDNLVEPNFFATNLRTGSPKNDLFVDAVWFKADGKFLEPMPDTNSNTLLVTFSQRPQGGGQS